MESVVGMNESEEGIPHLNPLPFPKGRGKSVCGGCQVTRTFFGSSCPSAAFSRASENAGVRSGL